MGNLNKNYCCTNYCKNDKNEFIDEQVISRKYSPNINSIIKLQSIIRRFLYSCKFFKSKSSFFPKITKVTESQFQNIITDRFKLGNSFDQGKFTGTLLEINASPKLLNKRVLEIEMKLGKFYLNEFNNKLSFEGLKKITAIFPDNSFYQGYINKYWEKEGIGFLILPDGTKYEGFFENDKMSGLGRLINPNGYYYEGNFSENKANGHGKHVSQDGAVYIGGWHEDKQHGMGEEVFTNGSRYEGQFVNGQKHGKGLFIFQDSSQYKGEFFENLIHGYGKYKWSDGKVFHGTWKNNKMDGCGLFIWPDKKKYIGEYLNDKKQGYGIFLWPDGKKYEGMWEDGKQHGFGNFNSSTIDSCGEWQDGKKIRWIEKTSPEYDGIKKGLNRNKIRSNISDIKDFKVRE